MKPVQIHRNKTCEGCTVFGAELEPNETVRAGDMFEDSIGLWVEVPQYWKSVPIFVVNTFYPGSRVVRPVPLEPQ